nr:SURF1 family protein [Aerococcus tenax]
MLSDNRFFRPLLGATVTTVVALAILIGLGLWQIERLHWKLGLIATINERMAAEPIPAPLPASWPSLDLKSLEYRHLRLTGRFDNAHELYYFTQDDDGTAGYDVVTPFALDTGGTVFVDRGFVPEARKDQATRKAGLIEGPTALTGVARAPQARGAFDAQSDPAKNIWFTRDPAAMAAALKLADAAPFYVEADATPNPGGLPVGGRTRVNIRNEHLQYAITWFGLAVELIGVYLSYHWSQGRIGRRKS